MPAEQRGQPFAVRGGYGIRYYGPDGKRKRFTPSPPFPTKTAARRYFREVLGPRIHGLAVAPPDVTFADFVPRYLESHAVGREASTIATLRHRLGYAEAAFGDLRLSQLEHRAAEIAAWTRTLPEGSRHGIVQALRQCLDTACRWGHLRSNPARAMGRNPQPRTEEIRPFTTEEVDRLAAELGDTYGPLVVFAAATGLRPAEWIALERRDVDRRAGVVVVERTFSSGRAKPYAKTERSRRRVPLSSRALQALDALPARLDTPLVFPGPSGSYLDLHNWRARVWRPACETAGFYVCCDEMMESTGRTGAGLYRCRRCKTERPARRIYDLRHTFATDALAAGLSIFELARYMGTSVAMIDRRYGHLAQGSEAAAREKLDRLGREGAAETVGATGAGE